MTDEYDQRTVHEFEEAKRLSIMKWELLLEKPFDYDRIRNHPEFLHLTSRCGMCEYYESDCDLCPLDDHTNECAKEHAIFWSYVDPKYGLRNEVEAKIWAKRLLDRIKEIKE